MRTFSLLIFLVSPSMAESPKAKLVIGKETTVVDGPLTADGWIDYAAALNAINSKGVTFENNAQVLLMQVLGPKVIDEAIRERFFKELGFKALPTDGPRFISWVDYLYDVLKLDEAERAAVLTDQVKAEAGPWSAKDYPRVDDWLTANAKPFELMAQATLRPRCYLPVVLKPVETEFPLLARLMPDVQARRGLVNALKIRALRHLHDKNYDSAWADAMTLHRLGRLCSNVNGCFDALVGIAFEMIAQELELKIVQLANWPAATWQSRMQELDKLPTRRTMAEIIDVGERFNFLDTVQQKYLRKPDQQVLDCSTVMKTGNPWYDRIVAAMRLPTRAERQSAFPKIDADMKKAQSSYGFDVLVNPILASEQASIGMVRLLMSLGSNASSTEDRLDQRMNLLKIALALEAWRDQHGKYPIKLDDLNLPKLTVDIFSGKPLIYKPEPKGYLLYSVGENGRDDGGAGRDATPPGDDLTVRVEGK